MFFLKLEKFPVFDWIKIFFPVGGKEKMEEKNETKNFIQFNSFPGKPGDYYSVQRELDRI